MRASRIGRAGVVAIFSALAFALSNFHVVAADAADFRRISGPPPVADLSGYVVRFDVPAHAISISGDGSRIMTTAREGRRVVSRVWDVVQDGDAPQLTIRHRLAFVAGRDDDPRYRRLSWSGDLVALAHETSDRRRIHVALHALDGRRIAETTLDAGWGHDVARRTPGVPTRPLVCGMAFSPDDRYLAVCHAFFPDRAFATNPVGRALQPPAISVLALRDGGRFLKRPVPLDRVGPLEAGAGGVAGTAIGLRDPEFSPDAGRIVVTAFPIASAPLAESSSGERRRKAKRNRRLSFERITLPDEGGRIVLGWKRPGARREPSETFLARRVRDSLSDIPRTTAGSADPALIRRIVRANLELVAAKWDEIGPIALAALEKGLLVGLDGEDGKITFWAGRPDRRMRHASATLAPAFTAGSVQVKALPSRDGGSALFVALKNGRDVGYAFVRVRENDIVPFGPVQNDLHRTDILHYASVVAGRALPDGRTGGRVLALAPYRESDFLVLTDRGAFRVPSPDDEAMRAVLTIRRGHEMLANDFIDQGVARLVPYYRIGRSERQRLFALLAGPHPDRLVLLAFSPARLSPAAGGRLATALLATAPEEPGPDARAALARLYTGYAIHALRAGRPEHARAAMKAQAALSPYRLDATEGAVLILVRGAVQATTDPKAALDHMLEELASPETRKTARTVLRTFGDRLPLWPLGGSLKKLAFVLGTDVETLREWVKDGFDRPSPADFYDLAGRPSPTTRDAAKAADSPSGKAGEEKASGGKKPKIRILD